MSGPDAPRRLVVRLPNWLGDVVMALPALAALRVAYPQAVLALAGQASVMPLFEEAQPVQPQQLLTVSRDQEAEILRLGAFDAALLLTNSFRSAFIARRSGIPERWGYAAGLRRPLLTKAIARPRGTVHQSDYYLQLVESLGVPRGNPAPGPLISVTPPTRSRAARLLEQHGIAPGTPMVGFAPGAAYGHAKRWPPERVAGVVARLTRERGVQAVLVGAGGDREAGRAIESTLPPGAPVVNLIGRTDLRQLMGVISACRAFVSNDSGAMHLASALGVPVTAIFGPTNERATAPLGEHDVVLRQVFCRPCMLRECPIDHRCMKRIREEDVFEAVTRRMDQQA